MMTRALAATPQNGRARASALIGTTATPTSVASPAPGVQRAPTTDGERVASFALRQLGKPYVFATSGPDTFDCSGLVAAAYREVGVQIPAYTFTQATLGREVDTRSEPIRAGDLIFTRGGTPPSDLGHVGIAISATEWVRAPRSGDVVKAGPIPATGVQLVRRLSGA